MGVFTSAAKKFKSTIHTKTKQNTPTPLMTLSDSFKKAAKDTDIGGTIKSGLPSLGGIGDEFNKLWDDLDIMGTMKEAGIDGFDFGAFGKDFKNFTIEDLKHPEKIKEKFMNSSAMSNTFDVPDISTSSTDPQELKKQFESSFDIPDLTKYQEGFDGIPSNGFEKAFESDPSAVFNTSAMESMAGDASALKEYMGSSSSSTSFSIDNVKDQFFNNKKLPDIKMNGIPSELSDILGSSGSEIGISAEAIAAVAGDPDVKSQITGLFGGYDGIVGDLKNSINFDDTMKGIETDKVKNMANLNRLGFEIDDISSIEDIEKIPEINSELSNIPSVEEVANDIPDINSELNYEDALKAWKEDETLFKKNSQTDLVMSALSNIDGWEDERDEWRKYTPDEEIFKYDAFYGDYRYLIEDMGAGDARFEDIISDAKGIEVPNIASLMGAGGFVKSPTMELPINPAALLDSFSIGNTESLKPRTDGKKQRTSDIGKAYGSKKAHISHEAKMGISGSDTFNSIFDISMTNYVSGLEDEAGKEFGNIFEVLLKGPAAKLKL